MEELKNLLEASLNEELLHIVLSGQRSKEAPLKIKIRPIRRRDGLAFQAALWDGKKEFHKNYGQQELVMAVLAWMSQDFKQMQLDTTGESVSVLASKKGKVTIRRRICDAKRERIDLSHNRRKRYLLPEGKPVPFLVRLGVMTEEGKVVRAKYDKFRQINRFLEFIDDICPVLAKDRELNMIDFGCGKSYLTFAIYYYLHEIRGYDIRITGLDLKDDVIRHCNALAEEFGYQKLRFVTGDIAEYEGAGPVDLVVTLHACDTATDYALAKAVEWKAEAILSVPCCQHELNQQMHSAILEPVLKYGLIKERMAALVTDGLRAALLEEAGYRVQVLEFIDMEHTPKNILIRAVRSAGEHTASERTVGERTAGEHTVGERTAGEHTAGERTAGEHTAGLPDGSAKIQCGKCPENNEITGKNATSSGHTALQECMNFLHVSPMLANLLNSVHEAETELLCQSGSETQMDMPDVADETEAKLPCQSGSETRMDMPDVADETEAKLPCQSGSEAQMDIPEPADEPETKLPGQSDKTQMDISAPADEPVTKQPDQSDEAQMDISDPSDDTEAALPNQPAEAQREIPGSADDTETKPPCQSAEA